MTKHSELTLAFIKKRPESAARVLASLPVVDSAAFTESIPTRYAVMLLARLNANSAASIIKGADLATGTAIIRDMEPAPAAAILRQFSAVDRKAILAELPRRQRHGFEWSLTFPPGTVGAGMSTAVDVLTLYDSVADALSVKKDNTESESDLIFVVDEARALIGVVTLLSLLRHREKTPLSEIADTSCVSVSPHVRLTELAGLTAWQNFSHLPVVSRRGELLGVIFRQAAEGAEQPGFSEAGESSQSVARETLFMMADGASALVTLFSHGVHDER